MNSFVWWQQAEQSGITYKPDITQSTTNTSTFAYDASGHLTTVNIQDGRPRTVSYVTDAAGQILSRVEASSASSNPAEYYYDFNGIRLGDIGNNGPSQTNYAVAIAQRSQAAQTGPFAGGSAVSFADFDQSFDTINPFSGAEAGVNQSYVTQAGDTLQSIAQAVWGDASLWYLIAEANGMFGAVSLQAGQALTIPSKVSNYHNDASTFRVYDPNKALGNVQPTVPRSHHGGCGILGQILLVVVAIAVTIFTQGALLGAISSVIPGVLGGVVTGAVAGAAGSIVSQGVGLATGMQSSFNWGAVGMAAVAGGVGGGINASGAFSGLTNSSFVNGAISGAAANGITQGVAVATGLQKSFDWTGVAAAGVSGGVFGAVSSNLHVDLGNATASGMAGSVVSGMASSIANAATRSLINGSDFGDNIMASLPDVIGQTVGNTVADRVLDAGGWNDTNPRSPGVVTDASGRTGYVGDGTESVTVTAHSLLKDIGGLIKDGADFVERELEFAAGVGIGAVEEGVDIIRGALDLTVGIPLGGLQAATGVRLPSWLPNIDHVTVPAGRYIDKMLKGQVDPVNDIENALSNGVDNFYRQLDSGHPFQAGKIFGSGVADIATIVGGPLAAEVRGARTAEGAAAEIASIENFVSGLKRFDTPSSTPAGRFEIEQTGPYNYRVPGGGTSIDIDGYRGTTMLDAKFVGDPANSPYVNGSNVPPFLRDKILGEQSYEMERYKAVMSDPSVPFNRLEIRTNERAAVPYFNSLMQKYNVTGAVVVVKTRVK